MVDQAKTIDSTYTPINGAEAKKMLKNNINRVIDNIAGFKLGLAFHRLRMEYKLVVTAYPADCPVPHVEFYGAVNSPDVEKQSELIEHFDKIEILEDKRARHLEAIAQIDKILDIARPVYEIKETLDAGDTPDELRIQEGLDVPVIQMSKGGRRVEGYRSAGIK